MWILAAVSRLPDLQCLRPDAMGSLVAEADKTHKAYIRVYMHVIHTYIQRCMYIYTGWVDEWKGR